MTLEQSRDNVRDLVAFVCVARESSFTKAAARLGMSQSTLSYTIKTLEERLGVRLISRTTRSMALTDAGNHLLAHAGMHLDGIDYALSGLNSFRAEPAGTIRISCSDHAADSVLQQTIMKFLLQYAEIKVEIVVDNALSDIVAERCDAGIRLGERLANDMIALRIGPDINMSVVATPAYFEKNGRPSRPEELVSHNCLALRLETHGEIYTWEFSRGGKKIKIRPDGQFISNSPQQIVRYCINGMGIACMPTSYFETHVENGSLVKILEDWCQPYDGYYLYYPSRRQPTPAFSILLKALRENVTI
ncbi:LysR family transcriptional regulator [Rahnella sp. PCH160]|uniref:LysR family transcriptional regulator n=1 Tax=Rahnella sp. PCH160 TaxID=3447928 RepID=UPI0039FD6AD1